MRKIPKNKHWFRVLILPLAGLALVTAGFTAPSRQSLFVDLAVGQSVTLDRVAGHWQIGILQLNHPVDLSYTVAEIGADCILFNDVTGLRQLRIPAAAVSAIMTTRLQPRAEASGD